MPPPCSEMPPPKKRKLADTRHKLSPLESLIPEKKIFGLIFASLERADKYNVICAEFNFSLQFGRWEERPEYK
jgi:hypothetical protein